MRGIVLLPRLTNLSLNLVSCDVGEQCHRGLSLIRVMHRLERLQLYFGFPNPRVLSCIGAIQHAPSLQHLTVFMDHRTRELTPAHIQPMAQIERELRSLKIVIQNARVSVTHSAVILDMLMLNFARNVETVTVQFVHVDGITIDDNVSSARVHVIVIG